MARGGKLGEVEVVEWERQSEAHYLSTNKTLYPRVRDRRAGGILAEFGHESLIQLWRIGLSVGRVCLGVRGTSCSGHASMWWW